ncbi:MAG: CIA30 family protein [Flavobacteriales bacterium]|jgi:NADH dehydrogenase [ubiquinone] 1 alpha subcomplex assembly factor 1
MSTDNITIFDFNENSSLTKWRIVNDSVMGGISTSSIKINEQGNGVFSGSVSTKNNGGFASVQYSFEKIKTKVSDVVQIRLKGDGKNYQFRVKANKNQKYSYITTFSTSGEWQTIQIELSELYPSFRGRKLDLPNFKHSTLEEITFLIANKNNESFELQLDKVELVQ